MLTKNQSYKKIYLKKKDHTTTPALHYRTRLNLKSPQNRGITLKLRIITPKKPNSARRPAAKVLLSNKSSVTSHIPGVGHNLRKHSETLIRGGGARDLPGVNYSCVRGKYGLSGVFSKIRRRSIYGVKRPDYMKKKLRRRFRKLFT
jgi:small subunit ribosomal protein S12